MSVEMREGDPVTYDGKVWRITLINMRPPGTVCISDGCGGLFLSLERAFECWLNYERSPLRCECCHQLMPVPLGSRPDGKPMQEYVHPRRRR